MAANNESFSYQIHPSIFMFNFRLNFFSLLFFAPSNDELMRIWIEEKRIKMKVNAT